MLWCPWVRRQHWSWPRGVRGASWLALGLGLLALLDGCEGKCTVLPLPALRLPGVSQVPAVATLLPPRV
jgi:hypothetical protein